MSTSDTMMPLVSAPWLDTAGRPLHVAPVHNCAVRGTTLHWVQKLVAQGKAVWAHRRRLAVRSYEACRADKPIRQWLSTLPYDASVYDLRHQVLARGWPYGLAGARSRLYRCGRSPVFAVCGGPTGSRWAEDPAEVLPNPPLPRGGFPRSSARDQPTSQRCYRSRDAALPRLRLCA